MIHDDYERLISALNSLEGEIDDLIEAINALIVVMAKVRQDERKGDQDDTRGVLSEAGGADAGDIRAEAGDRRGWTDAEAAASEAGDELTEEAAEYAAEYYKVLAEMREWAGEWNDPWAIVYSPPMLAPMNLHVAECSEGELRFATREDAKNCIDAVGRDRLIKYYFGVRDHEADAETE